MTPPRPGIVSICCFSWVSTMSLRTWIGLLPWTDSHMTGNLLKLILEMMGGSMSVGSRFMAALTAFCTSCMAASMSRLRRK